MSETAELVRCDDCGAMVRESPDGLSLRPHGCGERQRASYFAARWAKVDNALREAMAIAQAQAEAGRPRQALQTLEDASKAAVEDCTQP